MGDVELLNPMYESGHEERSLAPPVAELAGAWISSLDNGKWNADRLLEGVLAQLVDRHGVGVALRGSKQHYNHDLEPALVDDVATVSDGVLVAIGD